MTTIVQVNVSQTLPPSPSNLQKTGAVISQGGTLTSPGTYSLVVQPASLTPLLALPIGLSSLSWSGGVATATVDTTTIASGTYNSGTGLVTLTLTASLGFQPGSNVTISGATGTGTVSDIDGTFVAGPGTGGTTLEYTIATGLTLTITGGNVFAAHGVTAGDQFLTTIAGAVPAGYDGTFLALATSSTQFTFPLANPGSSPATGTITYTPRNVAELVAEIDTFFAQGSNQPLFVLELGSGEPNTTIAFLSNWIAMNPGIFYSYLVPRNWDGNANFIALAAQFENASAKTYFFVTSTLATYTDYADTLKSINLLIEAPLYGVWQANAITAASFSSPDVTATTTTPHGVVPGDYFTIAGVNPTAYNGTFLALAGTTGSTLVYVPDSAPGSYVSGGTLVASFYASNGISVTEFTHAADWFVTLNYDPTSTNKVTPLSFAFLFDVTPFPTKGNAALLATLSAADANVVGTGAEGGISTDILLYGRMLDGNPFNYWYSVDWVQINLDLNLANAVINGSNNPVNPLYYNQDGINRLQGVAASTMGTAITNGLALGTVIQTELSAADLAQALDAGNYAGNIVVNAEPFVQYSIENPNDYAIGRYAGLTVVYTPSRGFDQIIVNLNVTNFVAP